MASPAKPRAIKRLLPPSPKDFQLPPSQRKDGKCVTFKSEIIETSFGGTQSVGHIPRDSTTSNDSPLATSPDESMRETNDSPIPPTCSIASNVSYTIDNGSKLATQDELISINSTASFNDSVDNVTPIRRSTFSSNVTIKLSPDVCASPTRRHTIEKFTSLQDVSGNSPNVSMNESVAEWNSSTVSEEDSCSVTVAVRVRPFSSRELLDAKLHNVVTMDGNETTVHTDSGHVHKFKYDFSFWSFDQDTENFASQSHVYNCLAQPLLSKAFDGYNTCLFAYGQTGSGKSYSMMGAGGEPGVIPRFTEELFARIDQNSRYENVKTNVEISYIEIYNEKIHDLLATSNSATTAKKALKVREHPVLGPYVEGLPTFVVNSFTDVQGWLTLGNKNRATACTGMNDKSSRSHSVFTVVMTQTKKEILEGTDHHHSITSKINLVDLAGSERQSMALTTGERFREGANINKSLLTLGKVISLLAEQSTSTRKRKKVFISYRDSVLTWLLKESLGGNSKTTMLANISPAHLHVDETLSTLRYASQALSIVNVVRVNEDPKARLIRELRTEIDKLRRQTGIAPTEPNHSASLAEIASLREKLVEKESQMSEMTKSWLDKLAQSEARKVEELKILERAGVSFKIDNKLPNLVNLNEDPQLSEMLLYVIKEGGTKVGRMRGTSTHEIQLNGALIADDHCILNNNEGIVELVPLGDAPTYINGVLISTTTVLHHGDRVILGGDHYFRVNHPLEMESIKRNNLTQTSSEVKDFEFARQELLRAQEARVNEEREAARRQAQEEMKNELNQCRHGYENKLAQMEHTLRNKDSEMQNAEGQIHRLQKQKMLLEQEVLAGRQKQKTDLIASEKIAVDSRTEHSKLLRLLEAEKEKMSAKLRSLRRRRSEITDTDGVGKGQSEMVEGDRVGHSVRGEAVGADESQRITLYIQLREANKISQYLQRHTTFSREDCGDECHIRVCNTAHGVSTTWSVGQFLEKLARMRELYQGDSDPHDDEVFYSHADTWHQDERPFSPLPSPRMSGVNFFNSPLINTPTSPHVNTPDDQKVDTSSLVVMRLCKDLINSSLDVQQNNNFERETLADKTLHAVNAIKRDIVAILDILPDSFRNLAGQISDDCSLAQHCCVRIISNYQLLMHVSSLWSSTFIGLDSALINELTNEMSRLVRVIGNQLTFFYQGCENEVSSMVEDSAAQILDSLFLVCKVSGELSLATDTDLTSLKQSSLAVEPHITSHDMRQYLLRGCDTYVDKTIQGGIKTLEDCETKIQDLVDQSSRSTERTAMLAKNIEVIVSTSKVLLLKCQDIQVVIETSLRESVGSKPHDFYENNYRQCQGVISHVTSLVDSITVSAQLVDSAIAGDFSIEQFVSCAHFINDSVTQLVHVCQDGGQADQDSDTDISSLSNSQLDQLDFVAQEVILATSNLIAALHRVEQSPDQTRHKRLLPMPPSTRGQRS